MSHIIKCLGAISIFMAFATPRVMAVSYYTEGHADLRLGVADTLNLSVYCDGDPGMASTFANINGSVLSADQDFAPADIVICVPQTTYNYAQNTGGANETLKTELGLSNAGDSYWYLPQSSTSNGSSAFLHSPYLGIGAEQMTLGVFDNNAVDLTLLGMSGPTGGQFLLQQSGITKMKTADGIDVNVDKIAGFTIHGHDHYKYFFSKPGIYELTMRSSATRTSTGILETAVNTYTFLVGATVWKGTNGSNWSDPGNWVSGISIQPTTVVPGIPGYGSTVIFTTPTTPNQPLTQNISESLDLHGLVFTANAGAFQLGGQTLRLSVDSPTVSSDSPNNQIIGNPLELAAATTFAVKGTGNVTLSGPVSGSSSFTKTGSGTLILANHANHSGDTLISDGTLALSATGQIDDSAIENNSTFQILAGIHDITTISGSGITQILAGNLTVGSIAQATLIIGSDGGAASTPQAAFSSKENLHSVPEPRFIVLLLTSGISAFVFCVSFGLTKK
jgi:surface-anchored protein